MPLGFHKLRGAYLSSVLWVILQNISNPLLLWTDVVFLFEKYL